MKKLSRTSSLSQYSSVHLLFLLFLISLKRWFRHSSSCHTGAITKAEGAYRLVSTHPHQVPSTCQTLKMQLEGTEHCLCLSNFPAKVFRADIQLSSFLDRNTDTQRGEGWPAATSPYTSVLGQKPTSASSRLGGIRVCCSLVPLVGFSWSYGNGQTNNRDIEKLPLENCDAHGPLAFVCYRQR